jgi:hypothetical protein
MKNSSKLVGAVIVAAVIGTAGSAFAAPSFSVDNTQTATDFSASLGYFKPSDIAALDHARNVKVVPYNSWALDGGDNGQAEQKTALSDQMGTLGPQIGDTQKALSADPAALKVLKSGGISVGSVAGVEAGKNGLVTIYVE